MKHKNINFNGKGATMRKLIPMLVLAGAFVVSACGGGASNTENTANNPNNNNNGGGNGGGAATYTGPAPANADIQAFRIQFWDNIRGDNRCGTCHDVGGQGNSDFADENDVNDAYAIANTLVNTADIPNSAFVTKFTSTPSGHFCWESTQSACAAQLELWIGNWLNDRSGTGGRGIQLNPPADEDPSPVVVFDPNVNTAYYTGNSGLTIHELVTTNCAGCHVPNPTQSAQPISPQFAVADPQTSYDTASSVPLLNLNTAALSRFYTRIAGGHQCWVSPNDTVPGDCSGASADMLTAINFYIAAVNAANGPPDTAELDSMVKSRAVTLFEDGITAAGGNRFEASQIALYEFKLNGGDTVIDRSGVSPAANLTLFGNPGTDYEWLGSYGIRFITSSAKAQATPNDSDKLHQMITSTGEYTIEAWVLPGDVAQMDANIVTYGRSATERNFLLGQTMYNYEAFNRNISPDTNADGTPLLTTDPDDEDAQAALQHVVVTYDPTNGRRIYVNGTFRDDVDPIEAEGLSNWATGSALALGNEVDFSRPWSGTIRMLSIHNRALTDPQIRQNFDVGVGQKFYLMFEVGQHLGPECRGPDADGIENDPVRNPDYAPLCYVYLEAAQFDNKSFLFAYPRFINLDPNADMTGTVIQNMRIGINGREASTGQGFASMDVTIDGTYDSATGQLLSNIGTIFALENGPSGTPVDKLFLTFERLSSATPTKDYTENFSTTPDAMNPTAKSAVMIRSFEEINATMAKMTGVDRTTDVIGQDDTIDNTGAANDGTYVKVKQGLPGSSDIQTYVPSQQMAVTQLAIEYCSALVDDNGTTIPRATYFPSVTFSGSSPQYSFTGAERDNVINPLLERVFNVDGATELSTMPAAATVRTHLYTLMDDLNNTCSGNCSVNRSLEIMKATCAAAIASSPMLLQ